jgi:hypothetical protein
MKTHFLLALGVVLCAKSTVYGQAANDSVSKYDELAEIEVKTYVPQADIMQISAEGNISLNVSENDILTNSEGLLEMLKKMPLLEIGENNSIKISGKEKAPVFVLDNKPMPWSSLENFPVTQIEKVELLANPSGRMLAISNGAPIINIVSKKMDVSNINSYFVSGKINGRFSQRHQRISPNIAFGSNFGKFSITGNYNFIAQKRKDRRDILQETNKSGDLLRSSEANNDFFEPQAHDLVLNMYANPLPKHHININTNTSVHQHQNKTSANTLQNNSILPNVHQKENVQSVPVNQYFYLGYDYDIDKNKQFNAYIAYHLGQINYKTINLVLNEQNGISQENQRKSFSGTNFISSNLNYKQLFLDNKLTYETGIQYKFSSSNVFGSSISSSLLEEHIYVYYTDFKHNINEKLNYSIGLNTDYRQGKNKKTDWKQESLNFLPKLSFNWNIHKLYGIYLNYLFHVERPGFREINPDEISYNSLTYFVGNPNLKSEKVQDLDLTAKLNMFYLGLAYYNGYDEIFHHTVWHKDNSNYYVGYMNGKLQRLSFNINVNQQIKFYQFQIGFSVSSLWAENIYNIENVNFYKNKVNFAIKTNQTFVLPKAFKLRLMYNYHSQDYHSNYAFAQSHVLDFSISKSFLENRLFISLGLSDILYNYDWYDTWRISETLNISTTERRIWNDLRAIIQIGFNVGNSFSNDRQRKDKDLQKAII